MGERSPRSRQRCSQEEKGEARGHCVTEAKRGRSGELCSGLKGDQGDREKVSFEILSNRGISDNSKTSVEI